MTLSREEGAMELLKRIREFIGEVSRDPQYGADGSTMLTEVERLEFTIRKLAEEAARPSKVPLTSLFGEHSRPKASPVP
jgi:hypothetical protein